MGANIEIKRFKYKYTQSLNSKNAIDEKYIFGDFDIKVYDSRRLVLYIFMCIALYLFSQTCCKFEYSEQM